MLKEVKSFLLNIKCASQACIFMIFDKTGMPFPYFSKTDNGKRDHVV